MSWSGLAWKRIGLGLTSIIRVGLGCMFLWSALPKIRQPYVFLSSVYEYELSGPKLGLMVAMVIPWLELILGICLIGGIFIGGALLATLALMVLFTFAHASVLSQGLAIRCGCFSFSESMISYGSLIINCLILTACLLTYIGFLFQPLVKRELSKSRGCKSGIEKD